MSSLSILPEPLIERFFRWRNLSDLTPPGKLLFFFFFAPIALLDLPWRGVEQEEVGPGQGGGPWGSVLSLCSSVLHSWQFYPLPLLFLCRWMTSVSLLWPWFSKCWIQFLLCSVGISCGDPSSTPKDNPTERESLISHHLASSDSLRQWHHDFCSYTGIEIADSFSETNC